VKSYIDIHTHRPSGGTDVVSVFNQMLQESSLTFSDLFSIGLHPWYADQVSLEELSVLLDHTSMQENLYAFGECGLDKNCKISFQKQQEVFELHLEKCLKYRKPIVIHCIRAWDEIIEMTENCSTIKILHGYNGSKELTTRLLKKGFCFSVGEAILNPNSKIGRAIQIIPTSALFLETDTSQFPIQAIYKATAIALNIGEKELREQIFENFLGSMSAGG